MDQAPSSSHLIVDKGRQELGLEKPPQTAASYNYQQGSSSTVTAAASAREIAPILFEALRPRSVVDFGCALGDWLVAFEELGVEDTYGLDGNWVPPHELLIPRERFKPVDFTQPITLNRRFDLTLCLEVAEHFGASFADTLVASLARHSDVICFSAAIPGQGGYEHVNEQFQDYWVSKFRLYGFRPVDFIRARIWDNGRVSYWYRQNMLLFLNESAMQRTGLQETPQVLSCVHPELYNARRDPRNFSLRTILGLMPYYIRRAIRARLGP